jgi:hypothetical protein
MARLALGMRRVSSILPSDMLRRASAMLTGGKGIRARFALARAQG